MGDVVGIGAATEPPSEPFRLAFVLDGDPVPWQRTELNGKRHFTARKTRAYQDALAHAGKAAMKWAQPVHTSLVVRVWVYLPIPRSWSAQKRKDASAGAIRPTAARRDDWDNFGKTVCDALNGIVWDDDGRIVTATVEKWYSAVPHMRVEVEEWEPSSQT